MECEICRTECKGARLCPRCRRMSRLSYSNYRNLFRRTCDKSSLPALSIYSPDRPFPVYLQSEWSSDHWNAKDYGRDYDLSKSFFKQYESLQRSVPRSALLVINCENCDYNNRLWNSKNSFYCFDNTACNESLYIHGTYTATNSMEVWWTSNAELCYDIFSAYGLYHCFFCQNCASSNDLYFCQHCRNCHDCFGCYGLEHKCFCVFNRQVTETEYRAFLDAANLGSAASVSEWKRKTKEAHALLPHQATISDTFCEDCTGDNVFRSKHCSDCFYVADCQDCSEHLECARNVDCSELEFSYDCTACTNSVCATTCHNSTALSNCDNCSDCAYSQDCLNCKNCLGCVGMSRSEYCILNKEYSPHEYRKLRDSIEATMRMNKEWGEFFPIGQSDFGYNQSNAMWIFPMSRDEAIRVGAVWSDYQSPPPQAKRTIDAEELPDHIQDVTDDILTTAIRCERSGRLFRIQPEELRFYRREGLPIPRRHPDERYLDLLAFRNPFELWQRECSACKSVIPSSYSPDRLEPIMCTECWWKKEWLEV